MKTTDVIRMFRADFKTASMQRGKKHTRHLKYTDIYARRFYLCLCCVCSLFALKDSYNGHNPNP